MKATGTKTVFGENITNSKPNHYENGVQVNKNDQQSSVIESSIPFMSTSSSTSSMNSQSIKWKTRYRERNQSENEKKKGNKFIRGVLNRGRTLRRNIRHKNVENNEKRGRRLLTMTNDQRLRMCILREIVETEKDYVELLSYISENIKPDLHKIAHQGISPICTKSCVNQFLGNIDEVHLVHKKFLEQLQACTSPFPFHTNLIGKVFLQFKDEFQLYDTYCVNFAIAQKISYELEKDPALKKLIEKWKSESATKSRSYVRLEGFIISPVQRLCKYPLLLRELIKRTPQYHADFNDTTEALKQMHDVTASVNESEKKAIIVQAVRDLENVYDNWERSENLSKSGFLTKRGGLTNSSWNIRWFTLIGFKLSYYNEPADLKPLGIVDLTSYVSLNEDSEKESGRSFCFSINMKNKSHYMYATNDDDKREWLDIIRWKIRCIERSREQSHKPMETMAFSAFASIMRPRASLHQTIYKPKITDQERQTKSAPSTPQRTFSFLRRTLRRKKSYNIQRRDPVDADCPATETFST